MNCLHGIQKCIVQVCNLKLEDRKLYFEATYLPIEALSIKEYNIKISFFQIFNDLEALVLSIAIQY